ncbi:uncharacterized protein LOC131611056 [Vicia villosa]|uniref:uncharacterized protein LOC131611056 n=1 Tax=Vicia villosa TaxID=3911 RepID=UPI00273A9163|nr:uncharacterized protein LOC131611056 [Vicia villosa]
MANKFCFEALDKSLKDIMSETNNGTNPIFGGKVIVFGGDFRQILPVVPRGSRSDIIHATINASYIWDYCKVLKLTKNMWLQSGNSTSSIEEVEQFSNWILQIGDSKVLETNDGYAELSIPEEFLIFNFNDRIEAIVSSTYPNLVDNYKDPHFLQSRAILASRLRSSTN